MTLRAEKNYRDLPMNGQLVTAEDPCVIGDNFQEMTNLRYTDTHPKGVKGMTKINTSALTTYLKPRSAFHLRKEQPAESHVLVQAWNTGLSASQIVENTTAIPSQGAFSGTALYTEASGANNRGIWAQAPDGQTIYCNGQETLIWAGNEMRVARFVNFTSDGSFFYDYTDQVTNTKTDAANVATMHTGAGAGTDANVSLLLHMDGTDSSTTFTDSSTATPKTVTANGGASLTTVQKKFGTASGSFDGTGDYLTVPDHTDFDFSGGIWTIDFWLHANDKNTVIYSQYTDANNYFKLTYDNAKTVSLTIVSGGVTVVSMSSSATIKFNTWTHVAVVENGDAYYLFFNGSLAASVTDTDRPDNYTGTMQIGSLNGTGTYSGQLDEFRISKGSARWTAPFTPPSSAYGTTSLTQLYVGSTRPLQGMKFYVGTANTTTSTMSLYYWDGQTWLAVSSLSDGTSAGGKTLAQTGSISFTSTYGLTSVKIISEIQLYWYRVELDASVDTTTTIYYVTVNAAMQPVVDIWDGADRTIAAFLSNSTGIFRDYSPNVFKEDYDSANTGTYGAVGGLIGTTGYLIMGFTNRMTGFRIAIVEDKGNVVLNTTMSVYYWSGTAWVLLDGLDDQTSTTAISFSKSGMVSWLDPGSANEFKYEGFGQVNKPGSLRRSSFSSAFSSLQRDLPALYFYKIVFDKTLTADVRINYIGGIPTQQPILGYNFPVYGGNRVMLLNETVGKKNRAIICNSDEPDVWNGKDSTEFFFGNDTALMAGACLLQPVNTELKRFWIICKKSETWIVVGNSPEDYVQYPLSQSIGCVAPATMKVVTLSADDGGREVAIWQGTDGIYECDGMSLVKISKPIRDMFESPTINTTYIASGSAFMDENWPEYHWLTVSSSGGGTIVDTEKVYDVHRKKWFTISRVSNLQCGVSVRDTNGNVYTYGFLETGYMERLENGTDFDGSSITHTLWTADHDLGGNGFLLTDVKKVKLIGVAKTVTSNSLTLTHYGETKSTGDAVTYTPTRTNGRAFVQMYTSGFTATGPSIGVYHSFKMVMVTNNETIGFEPLRLVVAFDARVEDSRVGGV